MTLKVQGFTVQRLGRIRTKWISEALAETLCTFVFTMFVLCSGAQAFLTFGEKSSVVARAMAGGVGLMVAVYMGIRSSGAAVNPNVAIMFCLLGKMRWKKLPMMVGCELIGAFLGACMTYLLHRDMIIGFDEHQQAINGTMSTVHLFASLPQAPISKGTAFLDIVVGTAFLDLSIAAITDPFNAGPNSGLIPLIFAIMLPGILFSFGTNLGCLLNSAIDLSGRVFAAMVYGPFVFQHWGNWFWIPIVAGIIGSTTGSFIYQLGIGNHLEPPKVEITKGNYSSVENLDEQDA